MAPRVHHDDDDFVFTISDDDADMPAEEEDVTAKPSLNVKKRKRDVSTDGNVINGTKKKSKKTKSAGTTAPLRDAAGEDGEPWNAHGQDDGAINPDFEFQIGDIDTGVMDDFDGWGLNTATAEAVTVTAKKGVDIDELIARRQQRKEDMNAGRGTNGNTGGDKHDAASDIKEGSARGPAESEHSEHEVVDLAEDEDELLAPDGFGMGATGDDEESDVADEMDPAEPSDDSDESDDDSLASPVPHPDDQGSMTSEVEDDDDDDPEEKAKQEAFFAPEENATQLAQSKGQSRGSFQSMSLSRPILRGLASVGFSEPTPIQTKTIPVALLGKDVVGGAVTGSGKTAAFMIPILERLLYRPKKVPTSRVAILMPTRELAVQCFNVARKLASFTDVTFCQLVGGFSLREQESVLRTRPDVIIATPGRFIDHMRNSASFTLDTLEILVLDEADRMLEDGFADELNEILTTIPRSRQTMLFSATMTSSVDKLIRVGLNRPVRLMVDARKRTVGTLVQEFVRLRQGREDKRLAYLMHLCSTVYTHRVIIFFRQKKEAHRVRVIFGLCGFKAAELHGSMSQEQRIASVESFRAGTVTHLLATDVASRGLDIKGVETVINYEAPQSHEIYLHRVGRTARAGRTGRACTLAAEPDRKVVKAAVRAGKAQGAKIVGRAVEAGLADEWARRIDGLETEVADVLMEEKQEKHLGRAEMQVRKGENLIRHESEIMARPKRTWFEGEREKQAAKAAGRIELNGADGGGGQRARKGKGGKMSGKVMKRLDDGRERKEGRVWKKGRDGRTKSGGDGAGGGARRAKVAAKGPKSVKGAKKPKGARH